MEPIERTIIQIYNELKETGAKRVDVEMEEYTVKGYWAGTIIRIDIKEE